MSVEIRPAGTLVPMRPSDDGLDILLLRRSEALVFAPGVWVFPGGRVDADEIAASAGEQDAARLAAVREAHEEAQLTIHSETLMPFAHWTTPPGAPRRFATWFFAAVLDGDQQVVVDGEEMQEYRWCTATNALQAHREGALNLMTATWVTLNDLAAYDSADALLAGLRGCIPERYQARSVKLPNGICNLYEGDAGYETGDPDTPGSRRRVLKIGTEWRLERSP